MKLYKCSFDTKEPIKMPVYEVEAPSRRVARWCYKNIFEENYIGYIRKDRMKQIKVKKIGGIDCDYNKSL